MFTRLEAEALAAFDRVIGLDQSDVALDGSLYKAPLVLVGSGCCLDGRDSGGEASHFVGRPRRHDVSVQLCPTRVLLDAGRGTSEEVVI